MVDVTASQRFPHHKPYPTYKDSGVEWLGEIPAHWEVSRADSLFRYEKIQIEPSTISEQSVFHYSIPAIQETGNGIFESPTGIDSAKLRIFGQRILISKLNPRKGVVLVADEKSVPTICSTEFVPLEIRSCDLGWAYHLLASEPTRQRLSAVVRSATRSHQRAEIAEVLKMWHGVPPLPEQRAIAAFLDRETAQIDAFVAKKERLIKLLQEKRTALISNAVTKGLDPDAPMKDSGVEWLGEIPAHWEVKILKRWASLIQTGSTPPTSNPQYFSEGTVPWHGPSSFSSDLLLRPAARTVTENAIQDRVARIFDKESSMIVTIGSTIGKVGFVDEPSSCNQQITAVTFDSRDVFAKYAGYQLKRLEPMLGGIAPNTTLPILDQGQIGCLHFFGPPMSEQRAITAFLDHETAQIDALVAKVRQAIDRLQELRTALISAAVTGKIDVREAAE